MKKTIISFFLLLVGLPLFAEKIQVTLPQRAAITITIHESTTSDSKGTPMASVAGDVYDETGEYILIKHGALVRLQIERTRGSSFYNDAGVIKITPISTSAYNGRLIALQAKTVEFTGAESALKSRRAARIEAGTTFIGYTTDKYVFTLESTHHTNIEDL